MLYSGRFLCFLLTYFVYISAYQKIYDRFHQLSEYDYELHTRVRRSSSSSSDGLLNIGNKTNCHNTNSTENCTINEQYTDIQYHDYYSSHYYAKGSNYFVDLT